MPHVILKGDVKEIDLSEVLFPVAEENEAWRIKIKDVYVEKKNTRALLSTVVVEEDHPQSFYILVAKNEAQAELSIRLDPSTDPIKTRGVKRSIAVVANSILQARGDLSVARHNINDFLDWGVIRLFTGVNSIPE